LRIQSRLNHVILNRRELTPIIPRITALIMRCILLFKTWPSKSIPEIQITFRPRKLRRPRFSFFSYSIVK